MTTAQNLHGISLTRPSCPFTTATPRIPEPKRSDCVAFNRDVLAFVRDHPQITTVYVSQTRIRTEPEEDLVSGYAEAWDALPAHVTRVVVLRDPFYDKASTPDCIARALRRDRVPARACALDRRTALRADPAITAARTLPHRDGLTVTPIDLTPFFCGARRCFPVVGGVLVHRDIGHITQAFARTLGPYLLRALERKFQP